MVNQKKTYPIPIQSGKQQVIEYSFLLVSIENHLFSFTLAFSAGDILIFTMRTIHMSSVNVTNKLRLSCDTRWQPFE